MTFAMIDWLTGIDLDIFVLINQTLHFKRLNGVMRALASDPLYAGLGIGIVITCLFAKRRQGLPLLLVAMFFLFGAVGTADVIAAKVKGMTERGRPYHSLPNVYHLDNGNWMQTPPDFVPDGARNYSFYSGHATNSMAVAGALVFIYPPAAPVAAIFSLIVGYSRVYVGKHFPSDVFCGWISGILLGLAYGKLFVICRRRLSI